jgi:hypothetical protein
VSEPPQEPGAPPAADLQPGAAPSGTAPSGTAAPGLGAMRDTIAIVTSVATGAERAAERARGLADRLGSDRDRMLITLGGGPPRELREAGALSSDAVHALDEAAAALREAASALRTYARRSR